MQPCRTLVVAHRGNAVAAPENTMLAFRQAVELGAEAIETDVRVTRDGHAVLFHDEELHRMTGAEDRLAERTLAGLRTLEVRSSHGRTGEAVPSLAECAALCRGRLQLLLDLKVDDAAAAIARALDESAFPLADAWICAWNDAQAADARRHLAGARLAVLAEDARARDAAFYGRLADEGYQGLSLAWRRFTAAEVGSAHDAGLRMFTWTIDDPAEMQAAMAMGVDGIITNDPGRLVALRDGAE